MGYFETKGLTKYFGGLKAVSDVSLSLEKSRIYAMMGPNGAGKTTFFNLITGMLLPSAGEIYLDGANIGGLPPNVLAKRGIARTFQTVRLFDDMTCLENVMLARHCRTRLSLGDTFFHRPLSIPRQEKQIREYARECLAFVAMADLADRMASKLSTGQRRRLEIARALGTGPDLLLLDEPTAGVDPVETISLQKLVLRLTEEEGKTILFIAHDMQVIENIASWVFVLNFGLKIAEGTPDTVRNSPEVIEAYLGKEV